MLSGIAFLLLALLLFGTVALYVATARRRETAQLDRRIAALAPAGAVIVQRLTPATMPERIAPILARAQIVVTDRMLWTSGILLFAVTLAMLIAFGPVAGLLVLVLPPLAAAAWIRRRADRRVEALIEALPYYVDGVRQLQAVGASLPQALQRALEEAPDIVRTYMAPVTRRLDLGAPINDAMQQLANRLRIPEVSMLASAIKTNIRYGGSMTEILSNLTHILRERTRIKRELKSATSEARVSAKVLIAMPLVAMALLMAMNPQYLSFFISDPRGHKLAVVAVGLQIVGMVVIGRLMRIAF